MDISLFLNNGTLIGIFASGMLILYAVRNKQLNLLNSLVESIGVVAVGTFVWDWVSIGSLESYQEVLITLIASLNSFTLVEFLTNTKRLRRFIFMYFKR